MFTTSTTTTEQQPDQHGAALPALPPRDDGARPVGQAFATTSPTSTLSAVAPDAGWICSLALRTASSDSMTISDPPWLPPSSLTQ